MLTDISFPKRVHKGIQRAIEESRKSNCPNFRLGAVLQEKKSVLGAGCNYFKKTSPGSIARNKGIHAEYSAVKMYRGFWDKRFNLSNATLFVARVTRTGIGMAKPCDYCQEMLRELGIVNIYYTNEFGGISHMELNYD